MKGRGFLRDKKVIKKERQQLLLKLSDLYREHEPIKDHEVESSKDCLICSDILAWKIIVERLESELEEIRLFDLKIIEDQIKRDKEFQKKDALRMEQEKSQAKWKLFLVETREGGLYYYRFKTKKKVQEDVIRRGETIKNCQIIPVEEYQKIYLERSVNNYVSLDVLDKANQEGMLGKKGSSKAHKYGPHQCVRKITEEVMIYTGKNSEDIITFCEPFEARKTKKGNKIQLTTPRGSQAVNPFDYVVKYGSRIELFSKEEFEFLYDVDEVKNQIWITLD